MDQVDAFTIFIPGKPRAQGRPRTRVFGQKYATIYMAKEDKAYTEAGKQLVKDSAPPFYEGAVHLEFVVWVDVPKSWTKKKKASILAGGIYPTTKPDLDNYLKMGMDIVNGLVFKDDAQVTDVVARKRFVRVGHGPPVPGMQIRVSRI